MLKTKQMKLDIYIVNWYVRPINTSSQTKEKKGIKQLREFRLGILQEAEKLSSKNLSRISDFFFFLMGNGLECPTDGTCPVHFPKVSFDKKVLSSENWALGEGVHSQVLSYQATQI